MNDLDFFKFCLILGICYVAYRNLLSIIPSNFDESITHSDKVLSLQTGHNFVFRSVRIFHTELKCRAANYSETAVGDFRRALRSDCPLFNRVHTHCFRQRIDYVMTVPALLAGVFQHNTTASRYD